ncbi:PREDICTED: uncharacterized protein LOC107337885 [Acropora digitifera]|uniref:uncharacterized protein LOC107337885 n=1 Tax=Acropora digitifera TaxID=70779 RepID=UPI00077A3F36|nr:PREDICTED: uncharacterized protein LOC107337885 [Acropora digitifera]
MKTNVSDLDKNKVGSKRHVSAVVSSLAIAVLVHSYGIVLKNEELVSLLRCLALEVDPSGVSCTVYEEILKEFSLEYREYAAKAIESLCNEVTGHAWDTSNFEWLSAVPLLHFFRGDSKPFQEPKLDGWPGQPAWWGVEKLNLDNFKRSKFSAEKWDFLPRLASAFAVDRLLRRTILFVIPVWHLGAVAVTRLFPVSDLCVALTTFLPRRVKKEKWKNIERCVQEMLDIMESEKGSNRPQGELAGFRMSSCLKLAMMFIETHSLRDCSELICLSIKLFFTSVHRWEIGQENEIEHRKERAIDQLLEKLQLKAPDDFCFEIAHHSQRERLTKELQVWSRLLRAGDGFQEAEIYRSHLTKQFEDRAAKMRGIDLCEIFCDVKLDQFGAIGESLTKLAFDAVDKIINSRGRADTERAFETLSQGSTLGKRAEKCGELLSTLLTKSWPKSTRKDITSGLDPVTVEFLLSWNPMPGYFRFFGDESERGRILTEDGQATLYQAKSLLTALVKSISDATITVVILELLHKYQDRFLQLLEANSLTHNMEAKETERNLSERITEIREFQALKTKVSSFIHMCQIIPPVNVTAIKKYIERDVSHLEVGNLCQRKDDNSDEINFWDFRLVFVKR